MKKDINVPIININLEEMAKDFDVWFEKTLKGRSENDIYNLLKVFFSFYEPNIDFEANKEKPLSEKLISFKKYVRVSNERKQ